MVSSPHRDVVASRQRTSPTTELLRPILIRFTCVVMVLDQYLSVLYPFLLVFPFSSGPIAWGRCGSDADGGARAEQEDLLFRRLLSVLLGQHLRHFLALRGLLRVLEDLRAPLLRVPRRGRPLLLGLEALEAQ